MTEELTTSTPGPVVVTALLLGALCLLVAPPTRAQADDDSCSAERLAEAYPEVREQYDLLLAGAEARPTWSAAEEVALVELRRCPGSIGRRAQFYTAVMWLIRGAPGQARSLLAALADEPLSESEARQVSELSGAIDSYAADAAARERVAEEDQRRRRAEERRRQEQIRLERERQSAPEASSGAEERVAETEPRGGSTLSLRPPPTPREAGRGLLIGGGVLAAAGFVTSGGAFLAGAQAQTREEYDPARVVNHAAFAAGVVGAAAAGIGFLLLPVKKKGRASLMVAPGPAPTVIVRW